MKRVLGPVRTNPSTGLSPALHHEGAIGKEAGEGRRPQAIPRVSARRRRGVRADLQQAVSVLRERRVTRHPAGCRSTRGRTSRQRAATERATHRSRRQIDRDLSARIHGFAAQAAKIGERQASRHSRGSPPPQTGRRRSRVRPGPPFPCSADRRRRQRGRPRSRTRQWRRPRLSPIHSARRRLVPNRDLSWRSLAPSNVDDA